MWAKAGREAPTCVPTPSAPLWPGRGGRLAGLWVRSGLVRDDDRVAVELAALEAEVAGATVVDSAELLDVLLGRPAWHDHAACRDVSATWFPGLGERTDPAKAVCARCPVRADCLDYALTEDIRHGVWGGTSPQERARLRRHHAA